MVQDLVLRCRGLPFQCTESELRDFFDKEGVEKVLLTIGRDGRPSGEAFVQFNSQQAYDAGLAKDHSNMGSRYVEVFAASSSEMEAASRPAPPPLAPHAGRTIPDSDNVVRLRGLPFQCTAEEIKTFFSPLAIVPDGVVLPHERRAGMRNSGEAFVCFSDQASATKALEKSMQHIQHRYIEVFPSSRADMTRFLEGGGWDGRQGGGYGGGYHSGWGDDGRGYVGRVGRPTPYDRPGGYPEYGYGKGGAYDRSGYGYGEQGEWGGYEANYDTGYGRGGGGGPMRRYDSYGYGGAGPYAGGRPMMGSNSRGFTLKMRGIPFRAVESDIYEFFAPLRPSCIEILREAGGRPSGEARVEFNSRQEYDEALQRDKNYMGPRYVELFPDHSRH